MQKITLIDYDPSWPIQFEQEKKQLIRVLPSEIIIKHIGSTSIPGLVAKTVFDIMIGVPSLEIADQQCIEVIKELGYTYVPEYEKHVPERRYFRKINKEGISTHHIHLVKYDSAWWKRHIQFRDYLRQHPDAAQEYAELKKDLASKFSDTNEYANAKTEFVKQIEVLADVGSQIS